MDMQSKFGQAYRMKDGETLQAADGSAITMRGDDVALLPAPCKPTTAVAANKLSLVAH